MPQELPRAADADEAVDAAVDGAIPGAADADEAVDAAVDAVVPGAAERGLTLLVLGAGAEGLPPVEGLTYLEDAEGDFDCVALIAPWSGDSQRGSGDSQRGSGDSLLGSGDSLRDLLEHRGRPLAPVATFGLFDFDATADFAAPMANAVTVRQAMSVLGPICARLTELPDLAGHPDRDGLLPLAIAFSRQRPIGAIWNPARREAVWYPALGGAPTARRQLEGLADLGLMGRRFYKRLSLCGGCGGSRLSAYEACVGCGSAQLLEEKIIHHYACGHETGESRFLQGRELICPKCAKELRHFGVDYDKPGSVLSCAACETVMVEPRVAFDCLDCGHTTPGEGIETLDWFHYGLVSEGVAALREGRLPHLDFAQLLPSYGRTYPLRDFLLLAQEVLRVAERYERPFAMITLKVLNREELARDHGAADTNAAFRQLVELFAESVRKADLVTAGLDRDVLVALPETTESDAGAVVQRFEASLAEAASLPIELDVKVVAKADARQLLESIK